MQHEVNSVAIQNQVGDSEVHDSKTFDSDSFAKPLGEENVPEQEAQHGANSTLDLTVFTRTDPARWQPCA